jgi:hypothetical protein
VKKFFKTWSHRHHFFKIILFNKALDNLHLVTLNQDLKKKKKRFVFD